MSVTKEILRSAARQALRDLGFNVELSPGQGLAPGARLSVRRDSEDPCLVAVRTSLSRQISLLRGSSGGWRTITKVQLVVAAVPVGAGVGDVEVLAFEPKFLMDVFDAAAAAQNIANPGRLKAPIFLNLDEPLMKSLQMDATTLAACALWRQVITPAASLNQTSSELIELLRNEIARATGVDQAKVTVEIRING